MRAASFVTSVAFASVASASFVGCRDDATYVDRPVVVHAPRACPVSQDRGFGVFYAGGDFQAPSDRPAVASSWLGAVHETLSGLPAETASLLVQVSQPPLQISWTGDVELPSSGPVNVLVWPDLEPCRLSRNVEPRTGETFGRFGHHVMVVGGRVAEGASVPATYVADLTTGLVDRLPFGLHVPRAEASVTAFDTPGLSGPLHALVAGGETPEGAAPLANAEIYAPSPAGDPAARDPAKDGALGDFEPGLLELSTPRSRHAAVVLATGETLLVGGRGPSGVLRSLEVVDPASRRTRTERLATLAYARERATALRLASGEILVAGGFGQDGRPVPFLEWLSPDGSRATKIPRALVTGRDRAFVPLAGGGALAVIAPEQPAPPEFRTVWVISSDGIPEPGLPVDPADLPAVRLFEGTSGAPLLFTGRSWMRWQPWFSAFQTIAAVATSPALATPEQGPVGDGASISAAPGLAMWISDRGEAGTYVTGYRFAARTPLDAPAPALLVFSPDGLAPDRLAGREGGALRFTAERGLELGIGASAFVADLTFADFDLTLDVTSAAPLVVLRPEAGGDDFEIGGAACAGTGAARERIAVRRRGDVVRVSVDDGELRTCATRVGALAAPRGRVRVGLRGGDAAAVTSAKNLILRRH